MRTALVTGARGFIGVHMAESLIQRGVHVRCLVRNRSQLKDLGSLDLEVIEGDVRDYESLLPAIQGMDAVFHLAGLTSAFKPRDLLLSTDALI